MVDYGDYPEAKADSLTDEWEAGWLPTDRVMAPERMRRSLFAPAQGANVPHANLFEQYLASGSDVSFGEWVKAR